METVRAVIFDLYGTLVYPSNLLQPYKRLFNTLALEEEEWGLAKRMVLETREGSLASVVQRFRPQSTLDLSRFYEDLVREVDSVVLYPEAIASLSSLRENGIRTGLISNLATPYKRPVFSLGLHSHFDAMLFSCDEGMSKPDPKLYAKMLDLLGVLPSEALMIGDNPVADVEGPKSAGMRAVLLERV